MHDYKLIRSKRRSVSLSISREIEIIVRAPEKMPQSAIDEFVQKHEAWIEKHICEARESASAREARSLSDRARARLYDKAVEAIGLKINFYSTQMGLRPVAVKITGAQSRWGSCTGKNVICFSYRIALLPDDLVEYIVVHELAHIQEKNHGSEFYRLVERFIPDHKERCKKIRELERVLPF